MESSYRAHQDWRRLRPLLIAGALAALVALAYAPDAAAHVKWFADFSFGDRPLTVREVLTPTFFGLAFLSAAAIGGLVPLDRLLGAQPWYRRLNRRLEGYAANALLVMRIGAGAVMLMIWQADALLAPELPLPWGWVGWLQFAIALLLIFRRTTPAAGAGLLFLWGLAAVRYGLFHLLDYAHFLGVGFYLLVANSAANRIRGLGLPALYASVGFSLMWAGLEKLVYPEWGLYLLAENPALTLGLAPTFFLTGAAFVELALGFLLIVCLLQRPLSLVVTLVFFATTLVFGKTEVIGHTLLHAALIVFVIEGPGRIYAAPITFHRRLPLRIAFGSVNFLLFVGVLLLGYTYSAWQQYEAFLAQRPPAGVIDVTEFAAPPAVRLRVEKAAGAGYNLQLQTENFTFIPPQGGGADEPAAGYAELALNGDPAGRLYGEWGYLPDLRPGTYRLVVTLKAPDGRTYRRGDAPVAAVETLTVAP